MQETVDQDGKTERKLVYIGNTWSACLPVEKYRRKKVVSAVLSACCVLLFLLANLQNTKSNIEGILPAFGIIVVIPLFVLCYGGSGGLWKKSIMTRAEYVESSMTGDSQFCMARYFSDEERISGNGGIGRDCDSFVACDVRSCTFFVDRRASDKVCGSQSVWCGDTPGTFHEVENLWAVLGTGNESGGRKRISGGGRNPQ